MPSKSVQAITEHFSGARLRELSLLLALPGDAAITVDADLVVVKSRAEYLAAQFEGQPARVTLWSAEGTADEPRKFAQSARALIEGLHLFYTLCVQHTAEADDGQTGLVAAYNRIYKLIRSCTTNGDSRLRLVVALPSGDLFGVVNDILYPDVGGAASDAQGARLGLCRANDNYGFSAEWWYADSAGACAAAVELFALHRDLKTARSYRPSGWCYHPLSKRVRPGGDKAKEYVKPY